MTTVVRGRHGRRRRDGPYGFVTGPASSCFLGSSTTVVSLEGAALVSSFAVALFEFACEVEKLLKDMVAPFGRQAQLSAPYAINGVNFYFFKELIFVPMFFGVWILFLMDLPIQTIGWLFFGNIFED
jgi:hypothetical protein